MFMKYYNNTKCLGCGASLNFKINPTDFNKENKKNKINYCQRCFKLINYSNLENTNLNQGLINKNFDEIQYNDKTIIFHILDILNLDNSVIKKFLSYQEQLYFVVNKMDCLPKKYNFETTSFFVQKTLEDFGFKNPKIIYTSIKINSTIKKLNKILQQFKKTNKKVIFIGKSNVGKSSLINALLKLNYEDSFLTVSPFINTTLNLINIKLNNINIIDTPGEFCDDNICNYLDNQSVKKIINNKIIKPKNFYINTNNALIIEKLCAINYVDGNLKASITCYLSNYLQIHQTKSININKNLNNFDKNKISYLDNHVEFDEYSFDLNPNYKHNITINGLGLISCSKGIKKIKIIIKKGIGVFKNLYAII